MLKAKHRRYTRGVVFTGKEVEIVPWKVTPEDGTEGWSDRLLPKMKDGNSWRKSSRRFFQHPPEAVKNP
jgi:hypothetical protein